MNIEDTKKPNSLHDIIERTFYKYTARLLLEFETELLIKYCTENNISNTNFTIEDLQSVFNYIDEYVYIQE